MTWYSSQHFPPFETSYLGLSESSRYYSYRTPLLTRLNSLSVLFATR